MTDIPSQATSVPSRLGVAARYADGELALDLTPQPETLHHGVVRASVLSFAIDAIAGVTLDGGDDIWTFTTDMSVRMRPMPAPAQVTAANTILRRGRRSATCLVEVTTDEGAPIASGAVGFVHVPRKLTDPPKLVIPPDEAHRYLRALGTLTRPVRDEAGIAVIDAAAGVVEMAVTPDVCNPAGTVQGAMVALLAEAAAEDLLAARFGAPVLVVDLDLRYLAQATVGPVRTRSRLLGSGPDDPVQVELIDLSADRVTTHVYVRAVPAPDRPVIP